MSGVAAYRTALNKAFAAEGLSFDEIGFNASTHHLRASLGGELKHQLTVDEMIRSEILGHLVRAQGGGAAVTVRSYTPALPQLEPHIAVAKVQGPFITEQIGGLFHPIERPHPLGKVAYLDPPAVTHARAVVEAAGLTPAHDGTVTFAEAVELAGVSATALRRAIAAGSIKTLTTVHAVGGALDRFAVGEVLAFAEHRNSDSDHISTEEAAQLLAVSQWSLVRLVKLGVLDATRRPNNRFSVHRAHLERRREQLTRLAELQERAVRVADAAIELNVSTFAVKRLLMAGHLAADPDGALDPTGGFYITRESIARHQERQREGALRARSVASLPDDWLALEDVVAASGMGRVELLALSGKGLIVKRDNRYRFWVHKESPLLKELTQGAPPPR